MVIIKLTGGLGNQMFQYAVASIIAKKNNSCLKIDGDFLKLKEKRPGYTPRIFELSIFKNNYFEASENEIKQFTHLNLQDRIKKKLHISYPRIYKEKLYLFDELLFKNKPPIYLMGYFQSYKYFVGKEKLIENLFSFPVNKLNPKNLDLLIKIKSSNSVSIHIRRGDYVRDKITNEFHGVCSAEYYKKAISILDKRFQNFNILFFSDDTDWVKEQFKNIPYNKTFVDYNRGSKSWIDMFLMSNCKHNIIANSSFSWWAAWLNKYEEKIVIAPINWFAINNSNWSTTDLCPPEWWITRIKLCQ